MRKLTMTMFVSLDGVVQAPGGPSEDTSDGFDKGGWLVPFFGDDMGPIMGAWFDRAGGFVLGRKTYDIFASHWPRVGDDDPAAKKLNGLPKYVASTTLQEPKWQGSTVLGKDVVAEIGALKATTGGDLQIHGSGNLVQTLMRHNLIDEYRLWVIPVVLGKGQRLFQKQQMSLELVDSWTSKSGVAVLTYEPNGAVAVGSFELES